MNNIYLNTVGNSNGNYFGDVEMENKKKEILKNVIVVGTKVDLYSKRMVKFSEAVELCKNMGLGGCVETSARVSATKNKDHTNLFDDLNDAFFMCACNCVDQTTREIIDEMGDSIMPAFMSPVGAQSLNNSNSKSRIMRKDTN